jgi:hypothetical protein
VSGKYLPRRGADQAAARAGSVQPADQLAAVLDRETNRRAELIGLVAALVILLWRGRSGGAAALGTTIAAAPQARPARPRGRQPAVAPAPSMIGPASPPLSAPTGSAGAVDGGTPARGDTARPAAPCCSWFSGSRGHPGRHAADAQLGDASGLAVLVAHRGRELLPAMLRG